MPNNDSVLNTEKDSAFVDNKNIYNKKPKAMPKP